LDGRKLIEKSIRKGQESTEIDVSDLESGIYFCTIKTNKGIATKKLIIQK